MPHLMTHHGRSHSWRGDDDKATICQVIVSVPLETKGWVNMSWGCEEVKVCKGPNELQDSLKECWWPNPQDEEIHSMVKGKERDKKMMACW